MFGTDFGGGAPDRIRTCDLRLRRATLYPAELRVRCRAALIRHLTAGRKRRKARRIRA